MTPNDDAPAISKAVSLPFHGLMSVDERAQLLLGSGIIRPDLQGLLKMADRLFPAADPCQGDRLVIMAFGVIRFQCHRLLKLGNSFGKMSFAAKGDTQVAV